jgi:hypothetical protein
MEAYITPLSSFPFYVLSLGPRTAHPKREFWISTPEENSLERICIAELPYQQQDQKTRKRNEEMRKTRPEMMVM